MHRMEKSGTQALLRLETRIPPPVTRSLLLKVQPYQRCPLPPLPLQRLRELDINIIEEEASQKDYSKIESGDVVIFPAFGATVQEMELFRDRGVQMVDTTCPWVAKVSAAGRDVQCARLL